jgi:hypothetical protein
MVQMTQFNYSAKGSWNDAGERDEAATRAGRPTSQAMRARVRVRGGCWVAL